MISACPTTVGVYVTLQVPDARVHVALLKVPVEFVVKVTVPVGVTAPAPEASVTVAVQVEATLSNTLAGLQATEVADDLMVDTTVNVLLLPM